MSGNDNTDATRFEVVLEELRRLVKEFNRIGVGVILVGGQALAAEQRESGGSGVIMVRTETGLSVERGYSLEPDLLIDVGCAAGRIDAIGDVMRSCDFERVRTARWSKSGGTVAVDLFIPEDTEEWADPGAMRLPKGDVALLKPRLVQLRLQGGDLNIHVPDPVGFLAMKLEAKQRLRPNLKKDSFDMYAYVSMKGIDTIAKAILSDSHDGPALTTGLASLFGHEAAPGVQDVLAYADGYDSAEQALLARAVVDLFQQLAHRLSGDRSRP